MTPHTETTTKLRLIRLPDAIAFTENGIAISEAEACRLWTDNIGYWAQNAAGAMAKWVGDRHAHHLYGQPSADNGAEVFVSREGERIEVPRPMPTITVSKTQSYPSDQPTWSYLVYSSSQPGTDIMWDNSHQRELNPKLEQFTRDLEAASIYTKAEAEALVAGSNGDLVMVQEIKVRGQIREVVVSRLNMAKAHLDGA